MTKLLILLKKTVGSIFRPQYISHGVCDIYEGRSFYIQTLEVKNTQGRHSANYQNIFIDVF